MSTVLPSHTRSTFTHSLPGWGVGVGTVVAVGMLVGERDTVGVSGAVAVALSALRQEDAAGPRQTVRS
jgi:hypothetical protein